MDLFTCLLGQAVEDGRSGGLRGNIPPGVFAFEDAGKPGSVSPYDGAPSGARNTGDEGKEDTVRPFAMPPGDPVMLSAGEGEQAEDEGLTERERHAWWQADACAETTLDVTTFILTFIYEVIPLGLAGLLCWLVEGKASAQNRNLVPILRFGREHALSVLSQGVFTTLPWIVFLLWLAFRPAEVPAIDTAVPFITVAWRASCVAMKYGYFAPSDLERVRASTHFTDTKHTARTLGAHKFFNAAGTLLYDHLEDLFKAALRTNLLEEARTGYLTVRPSVAKQIWERLREDLEPERMTRTISDNIPNGRGYESKYGNLQKLLGLDSMDSVDAQVAKGKLPVIVTAYYFIHQVWQGGRKRTARIRPLILMGASISILHPLVSHIAGKPGFGTSAAAHAIYALRVVSVMVLLMPTFLYLSYPVLDSGARWKLSWSLVSSFGRGEARARRLCKGYKDPDFDIITMSDLRAFWCLTRLLGPAYETGRLIRYNSAVVSVHIFFMCVATVSLWLASKNGETSAGVAAELTVLFAAGSVAVVTASLFCVNLNWQVPLYISVARQAALQRPELGGVAKDVCADLQNEHMVIGPVQIMYITATPALLSILWSGMVLLAGVFLSTLPSVCLPLLLSMGCG